LLPLPSHYAKQKSADTAHLMFSIILPFLISKKKKSSFGCFHWKGEYRTSCSVGKSSAATSPSAIDHWNSVPLSCSARNHQQKIILML
jgi:hypothetical protein